MDSFLTVTAAATTRDFTTLATAKLEMGITDTSSDALLQRWISASSANVEAYLHRQLAAETVREEFRQRVGEAKVLGSVLLDRRPVTSITSVTVDGSLLDPAEYQVNTASMLFRLTADERADWDFRKLVVVYTAGYSLIGVLPRPIEQATLLWIKHRWASKDRDPSLKSIVIPRVQEETYWVGGGSSKTPGVPDEIAGMLDAFADEVLV